MSETGGKTSSNGDLLTELIKAWAARYSHPLENLSADRLVRLIDEFLHESPEKKKRQSQKRWDHEVIERIIPAGARVMDLGCGGGELLERLVLDRGVKAQGVEIDPDKVCECIGRGVSVFQADLDEGLPGWPDNSFDYVILEETLQTVHRPVRVLSEMIRVGRRGIVSFPNFGYWHTRLELGLGGRMPVNDALPYPWYETPNIHLCTVEDFNSWAREAGVKIIESHVLAEGEVREMREDDNLFAEEALYVVQGNHH